MAEPYPGLKIAAPERMPQQGGGRPPPPPASPPPYLRLRLPPLPRPPAADVARPAGRHQVRGARAQGGVLPVLGHESIGPHRARRPHLLCWPLACIPCCMKSCHESYQVPVFGPPAYQPPVCPFVAPPAQGIPTTGKGS